MQKMTFLIFFFLGISTALSRELVRLDEFESLDLSREKTRAFLYITKDCSICAKQISILKECELSSEVKVLIDGDSEEKLRFSVKRKKIPYKAYLLTKEFKEELKLENKSPQFILVKNDKTRAKLIGLKECDEVKLFLKSRN